MANVTFTANNQPAPACYPPDVNGMLNLIANGGISGTIPDNAGGGIYVGSVPPSSSLTNKLWARIDGAGRPLGMYMFYNGNWRKVYNGSYGDIKLYVGPFNGVFDGTGRGVIGGTPPYDQDGWQICNGNNGTVDMAGNGYFPASAAWNGTQWVSDIDGTGYKNVGGTKTIKIALLNLPQVITPHTYFDLGNPGPGTLPFSMAGQGAPTGGQSGGVSQLLATGTGPQSPINIVPTFIAMAYLMFIGYA